MVIFCMKKHQIVINGINSLKFLRIKWQRRKTCRFNVRCQTSVSCSMTHIIVDPDAKIKNWNTGMAAIINI